jgi:acetylornithine/N-succinyldiaminopimelate aminotransferase
MSNIYNCTGHKLMIPNMVNGNGIYLFDEDGKKYMDLESGVWCTSLGHNHPGINRVIKNQIDSIMHIGFCYGSDVVERSAEAVLSISGLAGGKCVFLCSGSEAIELARQISKDVTRKELSMTLHDSYLGSYSSVRDRSRDWYIFNWTECEQCVQTTNCRMDCEELLKIPSDVSEFIFEPGSASGFVRFPPKSLIQNIAKIIKRNGGKTIVNEVTTGMGRTGKWFGYQHYDIEPDLMAMGKGAGNGYPVSVTVVSNQTLDQLEGNDFKYMQSHQNDPLGAAIVSKVIHTIKSEDLISETGSKGKKFLDKLRTLVDGKRITAVRGRGLMFALDICDEKTGDHLFNQLLERGYIVGNRKSLFRIDPPLTISKDEFSMFIEDFKSILA